MRGCIGYFCHGNGSHLGVQLGRAVYRNFARGRGGGGGGAKLGMEK